MNAKRLFVFFILITSLVMSGCGAKATPTPQVAVASRATPTQTVAAAPSTTPTKTAVVNTPTVQAAIARSATVAPSASPTAEPSPTATQAMEFNYDLFDRGNGLCFVTQWEPVGSSHRVLEFLYGLRIKGDTLEEYAPAERGSDKGTWPSRVILVDAKSNRETKCGEVQARHPILFRMAPVEELAVQWTISMDWKDNPSYDAAYMAASVGSNHLGLFFGSEAGADLLIEVFDEGGNLISTEAVRVAGAFCSDCRAGTSLNGNAAQFATDPEDFSFDNSTRKVLTTDLYSRVLPKDFKGYIRWTVKGPGEWWLGELRPLSVTPSVTPTPTATATP